MQDQKQKAEYYMYMYFHVHRDFENNIPFPCILIIQNWVDAYIQSFVKRIHLTKLFEEVECSQMEVWSRCVSTYECRNDTQYMFWWALTQSSIYPPTVQESCRSRTTGPQPAQHTRTPPSTAMGITGHTAGHAPDHMTSHMTSGHMTSPREGHPFGDWQLWLVKKGKSIQCINISWNDDYLGRNIILKLYCLLWL